MSYRFLWRSKSNGVAFRRALDSLSPLLLEARVEATVDKLVLCSAADGLVAQFVVPFLGAANGDYVSLSGNSSKCVFSLDLKEIQCWLSTFREGMTLELSVALDNRLCIKFWNDNKTFRHYSDLTSLLVSQEAAFLPTTEWTDVDRLVEVSGPALNAVIRHHSKSNSHCRLFVEGDRLCTESSLRAVDASRLARTSLGGIALLAEDKESLLRSDLSKTPTEAGDCVYALETLKKVLKSCAFQEKKTGRVLVGAAPNVLHLVFKREGGPWLKYAILADSEGPPPPLPALAPLALTTDGAAEEEEQRRVVIKRKKKNTKRKRDECQAGA